MRNAVHIGAQKRIPKELVKDLEALKKSLTIPNPAYWAARQSGLSVDEIPDVLILFTETDGEIIVPRHARVEYGVKPIFIRSAMKPAGYNVEHLIEPRDDIQREAVAAMAAAKGDRILSLACGRGKTIIALFCAAEQRKFPLLVIVHTQALMDQWRKEIAKFYRDVEVGHIQADVEDWRGKKVAVAMLHSLVLKSYSQEFKDYWALVIFDETHRIGSTHFGRAAPMFDAERWGLTATLKREDGMDKVIQMHLGRVAYSNLAQDLKSDVYFVNTGLKIRINQFYGWRGRLNVAKLQNHLAADSYRNKLILSYINKAVANGRTVLVLGERVDQAEELCKACAAESKAVYVGSKKKAERTEALTKRVVFATQHIAKEGLDRPAFDTLIIIVPFGGKGRLQQSVGRIERVLDGKKQPLTLVFVDQCQFLESLANKMRKWFRDNDYKIKNIEGHP